MKIEKALEWAKLAGKEWVYNEVTYNFFSIGAIKTLTAEVERLREEVAEERAKGIALHESVKSYYDDYEREHLRAEAAEKERDEAIKSRERLRVSVEMGQTWLSALDDRNKLEQERDELREEVNKQAIQIIEIREAWRVDRLERDDLRRLSQV